MHFAHTLLSLSILLFGVQSQVAQALSLPDYLEQVKSQKLESQSNLTNALAGESLVSEKDLVVSPQFFVNSQLRFDKSQPQQPGVTYRFQRSSQTTSGFRKTALFGTQMEVGYELDSITLSGVQFGNISLGDFTLFTSRPYVTITQPLWQNGMGRSIQASYAQREAMGLQQTYAARYLQESLMVQAESVYWGLVGAREAVKLQRHTLEQSEKILKWHIRRREDNLNQQSDLLQAKAAYQSYQLQLERARNHEREASLAFNQMRDSQSISSQISDPLDPLPSIETIKLPSLAQAKIRTDVQAAEQEMRRANATSMLGIEADKPRLDLSITYMRSGQANELSKAQSSFQYPTANASLQFVMPLDLSAQKASKEGYLFQEKAAELTYQQKLANEKVERENLTTQLNEANTRARLAMEIEKTQRQKLDNEHRRFQIGRTTTYQVLVFEQDYLNSQLARVNAVSELLNLIAQSRFYHT